MGRQKSPKSPSQENIGVDDTALVKACLENKDIHAKARITMDALGDGGLPDPNQEIGTDMIATLLAVAELIMAEAEQALHTYWESLPQEIATTLELRFAAALAHSPDQ